MQGIKLKQYADPDKNFASRLNKAALNYMRSGAPGQENIESCQHAARDFGAFSEKP